MKKLYSITIAAGLALALSGCTQAPSASNFGTLNQKQLCNVKANGITAVLDTAAKYNKIAKKHGVEFKRLGMTTTQYIDETNKALKAGGKTVTLLNKKKKPTKNKVSVNYAAHRACVFAVGALTLEAESKTTWRAAVPGDGFKY